MRTQPHVKYPSLLAGLFTSSFVDKLLNDQHVAHINGIFKQTGFDRLVKTDVSVKTALYRTFKYLNRHYRCEYVYKTAILDEILLKRHDLVNSIYLTEFRAFNAKADIVILNGTSTVYEIKSDIDRLDRLLTQVTAYQRIFDKVFVVSSEENASHVKQIVPAEIGVIVLQKDLSICTVREAQSNIYALDKSAMFDSLRKPEYLSIIHAHFGYTPDAPGTIIHSVCKQLFTELSNEVAHSYFLQALKQRQLSAEQIKLVSNINTSLKCLLAEKYYSKKQCELIKFGLNKKLTV